MESFGHTGVAHFVGNDSPAINANGNSAAHKPLRCGHCGQSTTTAVIATAERHVPISGRKESIYWLRCLSCHAGIVVNGYSVLPGEPQGGDVEGLPHSVAAAWTEARAAASAGAFTAAELMCRKILMHVAVDKGAAENQNFAAYITYLDEQAKYVTPPMRPWVELIRVNGNVATHEIPATDAQRAAGTLTFTEQLLRLVYEMEHLTRMYTPPNPTP